MSTILVHKQFNEFDQVSFILKTNYLISVNIDM